MRLLVRRALTVFQAILGVTVVVVLGGSSAGAQTEQAVPTVEVDVRPADERFEPLLIDELAPDVVLRIRARDFGANVTGSVRQCAVRDEPSCGNILPVRFDDRGEADVQYLITDQILTSGGLLDRCGTRGVRCRLEVSAGRDTAVVETIFGVAAPPPGRIEVTPRNGLVDGDTVVVRASRFPAGVEVVAAVCARPAVRGDRCGAPGPEVVMVTDRAGRAEAPMVLDVNQVGADRVACGRRTPCQVVMLSDDVTVRAPAVVLGLADSPGASYDVGRVVLGLVVAAGLLAGAGVLIRRTDWEPPSEADSSAIDDALFADLDAEAAAHDELEAASR